MSSFLKLCQELFDSKDLYVVLGVDKKADNQQVKKGYYKKSLLYHPDRAKDNEKELATKKFQILGKAYSILSDKEKRAAYDDTGCVEDEDFIGLERDWSEYFRIIFPKVSLDDIKKFEEKYKGSDEEREDLKEIYISSKGDMDVILDSVMCSTIDDEPRYREILLDMIKKNEVEEFKSFTREKKKKKESRRKRYADEALEAEELAEELGLKKKKKEDNDEDMSGLQALIQQRQLDRGKQMNGLFEQLEAKYGGKSGNKTGAKGKSIRRGKGKKK